MEGLGRLPELFKDKQDEMSARLRGARRVVSHPGEKGAATEGNWRALLAGGYLPNRYQVDKGVVIDVDGHESEQLDIIVFDQQYSPILFESGGVRYIPAESVYAAFEVKQDLSKANVHYAGGKIASVRELHRTSAPIVHAGGEFAPREPAPILGGLLTTGSEWTPALGDPFHAALAGLTPEQRLDIGCALEHGAFVATYEAGELTVDTSSAELSLVSFVFELLKALQRVGTVPAIDYAKWLERAR